MGSAPAEKAAPGKTLLILVVDESGSMYGPYERQVVPAMIEMMEQVQFLPCACRVCRVACRIVSCVACGSKRACGDACSRTCCRTWTARSFSTTAAPSVSST
jgi:hypothetical protein